MSDGDETTNDEPAVCDDQPTCEAQPAVDDQPESETNHDDNDPSERSGSRGVSAAPTRRPSSMSSRSLSTMPKSDGETHQLYLEVASIQMAKARQERIEASLQQQVDECRRQISQARSRTDELLREARQRENRRTDSGGEKQSESDSPSDEVPEDDPDTFEY
jgi:hypothetical protein